MVIHNFYYFLNCKGDKAYLFPLPPNISFIICFIFNEDIHYPLTTWGHYFFIFKGLQPTWQICLLGVLFFVLFYRFENFII